MTSTPSKMASAHTPRFLDHLPIPCLYFDAKSREISYANKIIHEIVHNRHESQHHNLKGLLLRDTDFADLQLATPSELDIAIDHLESSASNQSSLDRNDSGIGADGEEPPAQNAVRLRPRQDTKRKRSVYTRKAWSWTLSRVSLDDDLFFCLTGQDTTICVTPTTEDTGASEQEERWALLNSIARPSYDNVDHISCIALADMSRKTANRVYRVQYDELASTWMASSDQHATQWKRWSEDFTTARTLAAGVTSMALKNGKSEISAMTGLEDPQTGMRSVIDSTVTLLNAPYSDQLLGCIIQARPSQEWSEYLMQYDILMTRAMASNTKRPAMVRTMLLDGTLDYCSPTWQSYTQCSTQQLCTVDDTGAAAWSMYTHPQDRSSFESWLQTTLASGARSEREVQYREKGSGNYYWFKDIVAPWKNADGVITRWYSISTDVHKLVADRRAARHATERLYRIVHDMDLAIYEVNSNWKFTGIEGAISVQAQDGEDRNVSVFDGVDFEVGTQLVHADDRPRYTQAIKDVMSGVLPKQTIDYRVGPKHLRTYVIPIKDDFEQMASGDPKASDKIRGVLALAMDLSAQHAMEAADVELRAMKRSGLMKDEFLANVSHELRTPIAGILGSTDLLLESEMSESQIDLAQALRSSTVGLLRLVNDLLDISKVEANAMPIEKAPFSLAGLIDDCRRSYEPVAIGKGLQLDIEPVDSQLVFIGDRLRIRQILHNLLSNAIKFTTSGYVRFSTTHQLCDTGTELSMVVQDTGIGISDETMTRLFRPFEQADQSTTRLYGGTGLGLSIARKLAHAMGGEVSLASAEGQGTTSTFVVRLEEEEEQSSQSELARLASSCIKVPSTESLAILASDKKLNLDNVNILVVEDNKINQKVVTGHLRSLGLKHVACAEHGGEAIDYFNTVANAPTSQDLQKYGKFDGHRTPDLVLMDCQMPVLDGWTTTRKLRAELHYAGPVIALTASALQGYRQKCLDAGMNDYLTKPFTKPELLAVLMTWLPKVP